MAEPIREQVLAAVAARLDAIAASATPGEPYWTTPVVTRELLSPDQYAEILTDGGVILGVMRASGSLLESAERPSGWRHEIRFTVSGYVRATAGVLAGTWLERLWRDHMLALLADAGAPDPADRPLGGLVTDLLPDGPVATDDGGAEPEAWFSQPWVAIAHELIP
jgi:hypothetical protein